MHSPSRIGNAARQHVGMMVAASITQPQFASLADEEEFLEEFGDESAGMTPEQVKALQVRAWVAEFFPSTGFATYNGLKPSCAPTPG